MIAVAVVVCRLWARDLATTLQVSRARVVWLVVASVLAAVVFGALLTLVSGSSLAEVELPIAIVESMRRSAFAVAFGIAALIGATLQLAVPPFGSVQVMLELSPLRRSSAVVGTRLPVLLGGVVLASALAMMSGNLVLQTAPSAVLIGIGLVTVVVVVVTAQLAVWAVMMLVTWLACRGLGLRAQPATALAGAVTMVLVLAIVYFDIFALGSSREPGFEWGDLLLHRGAALLAGGSPQGALVVLAWAVLSVLAVRVTATLAVDRDRPAIHPLGRRLPTPRGMVWAAARLEAVQTARSAHFFSALVLTGACIGLGRWSRDMPFLADSSALLYQAAYLPFCVLALFATGRSRPHQWWGTALSGDEHWSTWPRALAHGVLAVLGGFVALMGVLLVAGEPMINGLTPARGAVILGTSLLVGALVPYGEEQPLSAVAGVVAAALAFGLISLGTTAIADAGGPRVAIGAALAVASIGMVLYAAALRRSPALVSAV